MTREDWDWTLEADLTLMWLTIKHAIPVFRRRGSGVIVNVASVAGMHANASHAMLAHSVSKAGVIRMTEFLAVELSPLDVRVNCISPGPIDTPALRASMGGGAAEPDWGPMTRNALVARIGTPDDIARAALFLASDEASFVTGQNLAVDGGASTGIRPSAATRAATDDNIERWMAAQQETTARGSVT
jgi:NAD(P)-dependent dehydrogenase (short-subunit alcohol dehydrogenase family)